MNIFENIYLIGSGKNGVSMSNSYDCNVYAINFKDEIVIVDAGSGIEPKKIIKNAKRLGLPLDNLKYLLLTHYHGDHAGGSFFWKEEFGVQVIAPLEGKKWLEEADEKAISLDLARKAGGYPSYYRLKPCEVDIGVKEGDQLNISGVEFQVLETPGHSNGHVSYYCTIGSKKVLFAGDTVFPGGTILLQNIYDCSITKYSDSVSKLNKLNIDMLLAGHLSPIISGGSNHIAIAHDKFSKLGIPNNFI